MKYNQQPIRITVCYIFALVCICLGALDINGAFGSNSFHSYGELYLYIIIAGLFLVFSGWILYTSTKAQQLIAGLLYLGTYLFLCILSSGFFIRLLIIPLAVCFMNLLSDKMLSVLYFSIPCIITVIMTCLNYSHPGLKLLSELVLILLILSMVWLIHHLIMNSVKSSQKLYDALSETALRQLREHSLNQRLAMQNQLIDRNARLEERESMGRTIHNAVGHTITAAIVTLDAAQMLSDTDSLAAKEKVAQAKERMQLSLSTIRQAVRLFDETNDNIKIADLYTLIQASITEFCMDTAIHIRTNLIADPAPEQVNIDRQNSEFLHGAVLEALSNGVRHGHATAFTIAAKAAHGHIMLTVMDNGTPAAQNSAASAADPAASIDSHTCSNDSAALSDSHTLSKDKLANGYGLKKIQSYVENAGGDLTIHQEDGFSLTITLPLLIKKEASL